MRSAVSHDDGGRCRQLSKDANGSPAANNYRAPVIGHHQQQGINSRIGQGSGKYGHCRLGSNNALQTTGQLGHSSHSRSSHKHDPSKRQQKSRSPPPAMRRYLAEGNESNTLGRIGRNAYLRGDERMSLYIDTWEKVWEDVSNVDTRNCTLKEVKVFGRYSARSLMLPPQRSTLRWIQTS